MTPLWIGWPILPCVGMVRGSVETLKQRSRRAELEQTNEKLEAKNAELEKQTAHEEVLKAQQEALQARQRALQEQESIKPLVEQKNALRGEEA